MSAPAKACCGIRIASAAAPNAMRKASDSGAEGKADDAGGADEDAENVAREIPGDHSQVSFISMLGSVTNRNGMKNVLQPTIAAVQPVVQPDTRAILAAA